MKRKIKGFTLVELMVVIGLVMTLSVISVPIYKNYNDKAKLAEGYALLGRIRTAQEAYYTEYGHFRWSAADEGKSYYTYDTCNDEILKINARTNKYFTWFRPGSDGGDNYAHGTDYHFYARVYSDMTTIKLIYDLTAGVTFIRER